MIKRIMVLLAAALCMWAHAHAFSQKIYKESKIRLSPAEITFPVYYFNNGFTTVFNATDLLVGDTLHPLLNRYDMLAGESDTVWVNDLVNIDTYDSTRIWEQIYMRMQMDVLYTEGQIHIHTSAKKQLKEITKFREEEVPVAGTNYYYAESKKSKRIFEYFRVAIGCPIF